MPPSILDLTDHVVLGRYKKCTPRILVYTDGLSFRPDTDFGLTVFVETLRASKIHGMTPVVATAARFAMPNADLPNYTFDHPVEGVLTKPYDVVFLLCFDAGTPDLSESERNALAKFMQAGGGVFATGDHSTLGAQVCGDVLRIRSMRRWDAADDPPHMNDHTRHSTNRAGEDETEEFDDQEDDVPQILYPNFRTFAGGPGVAHPLLQMVAPRKVLEVFPDHPHEGECVLPDASALAKKYKIDGTDVPEWPSDIAGLQVEPEAVAFTVSYGDGFASGPTGAKDPLTPKLFAALVAYDGHRAGVGRAVTDATWHHFVNVNLDGGAGDNGQGALRPGGVDSEALTRIRQYYVNLATWLMPKKARKCRVWPILVPELLRFPLLEEVVATFPPPGPDPGPSSITVGGLVAKSLLRTHPAFVVEELLADAVEDGGGHRMLRHLREVSGPYRGLREDTVALGALGGATLAMLQAIHGGVEISPHGQLDRATVEGARRGIGEALSLARHAVEERRRLLETLSRAEERAPTS